MYLVSDGREEEELIILEKLSAETSLRLVVVFFNGLSRDDKDDDEDFRDDEDDDFRESGETSDIFIGKLGSMSFSTNISYIAVVLIALEIILRKSCGALFNG